jgi:hypothetical protein
MTVTTFQHAFRRTVDGDPTWDQIAREVGDQFATSPLFAEVEAHHLARWMWAVNFVVEPGDMTRYDVVVGYNPDRHDAPFFAALVDMRGAGAYWFNCRQFPDGSVDVPHYGYLAEKLGLRGWEGPMAVAAYVQNVAYTSVTGRLLPLLPTAEVDA